MKITIPTGSLPGGNQHPTANISVLPDMTGIAATIDTSQMSKAALDLDSKLVVWTAHGVAEFPLKSEIATDCEGNAGVTAAKISSGLSAVTGVDSLPARIDRVSPTQISVCDPNAPITIAGRNLSPNPSDYFLGSVQASEIYPMITPQGSAVDNQLSMVTVTFKDLLVAYNKSLSTVQLTMRRPAGVANFPVAVGGTGCTPIKILGVTPPSVLLSSAITTLQPTQGEATRDLKVTISLPPGHAWSVDLTSKNGELFKVTPPPPTKALTVTSAKSADGFTLVSSLIAGKDPVKVTLDLQMKSLTEGATLSLTATTALAKTDKGNKDDPANQPPPANLAIPISNKAVPSAPKAVNPSPAYTFTSALTQIEPQYGAGALGVGTIRVLISFPSLGKPVSIDITASEGEITGATFSDTTPPANVTIALASGIATVSSSVIPPKGAKPFGIELNLRNLVPNNTLSLKSTPKPAPNEKVDPISVKIVPPIQKAPSSPGA